MGKYLNPKPKRFQEGLASDIYVDKSEMIVHLNAIINTEQKFVCVSRPRRFGKSMAVGMLAAYYSCENDTKSLFESLKISKRDTFYEHLNKYDVISLNVQMFLKSGNTVSMVIDNIQKSLLRELLRKYPGVDYEDNSDLICTMQDIYVQLDHPFIILVDEWDCILRERKSDVSGIKLYLDFLRQWFKDQDYVALVYMTGILPIKKYGTHSALNMFKELSMLDPGTFAEYVGFTEEEVLSLCNQYHKDFSKMRLWYDGYGFKMSGPIYNPKSVVEAILQNEFKSYWTRTETYESLKDYIAMDYDGLKLAIMEMMDGKSVEVNPDKFANDMSTFNSRDDVLTLLIHLGYLSYDSSAKMARIPNKEISGEYRNAMEGDTWNIVIQAVKESRNLLTDLWNMNEAAVAAGVEAAHMATSILQYNDENALSYTINLAFYAAMQYYTIVRELPAGKGFADLCFIPRPEHMDKPAIIIELKWNKNASGAITQIKKKDYPLTLDAYKGNLLMAGINYDQKTKVHECIIEKIVNDSH